MSKLFYTLFTKLIIAYFLSCNKNIPYRSNSKMHSKGDDLPITKLSNNIEGKFKFVMEIPDTMIDDAFKTIAGYKYYKAKKVKSENEANVLKLFKKNVAPRKIRSVTIAKESVAAELVKSISIKEPHTQQRRRSKLRTNSQMDKYVAHTYAELGQKLKGRVVDDLAVQSLLDLRKGSKASRLESLKQKKQPVTGEGSSAAHTKYYANLEKNNDLYDTLYDSLLLDQEALDDEEAEPSFLKRSHDHQDYPNNRGRRKRRKDERMLFKRLLKP
nr:hypothetical protein [Tanacetum cinerariifolium]